MPDNNLPAMLNSTATAAAVAALYEWYILFLLQMDDNCHSWKSFSVHSTLHFLV